jgi:hypothetical protein
MAVTELVLAKIQAASKFHGWDFDSVRWMQRVPRRRLDTSAWFDTSP